jgi:hypothetical protein
VAYRHRPVLTEVRAWIDRWDDTVRTQLERRPSKWQRERGDLVSSTGLDRPLNQVRAGHAAERRLLTDPAGYPSLRA